MTKILVLAAALVVLHFCRPLVTLLIAKAFGKAIGKAALARTADFIHLDPTDASAWSDARGAEDAARSLLADGFEDAGVHVVPAMPGLVVRLLVREEDAFLAAVCEHPKTGLFTEIGTRYADGSSMTVSSLPDPGLEPRPGHPTIRVVGATSDRLLARAVAERTRRPTKSVGVEEAVERFEAAYAESMAWRKGRGVTTREVVNVAKRMPREPVA